MFNLHYCHFYVQHFGSFTNFTDPSALEVQLLLLLYLIVITMWKLHVLMLAYFHVSWRCFVFWGQLDICAHWRCSAQGPWRLHSLRARHCWPGQGGQTPSGRASSYSEKVSVEIVCWVYCMYTVESLMRDLPFFIFCMFTVESLMRDLPFFIYCMFTVESLMRDHPFFIYCMFTVESLMRDHPFFIYCMFTVESLLRDHPFFKTTFFETFVFFLTFSAQNWGSCGCRLYGTVWYSWFVKKKVSVCLCPCLSHSFIALFFLNF